MNWAANMSEQNGEYFAGQTSEWDVVWLGGVMLPGVCTVSANIPEGIDMRKAQGSKRSTPIDLGDQAVELNISCVILPEHFEILRTETISVLRPADKATGRPPLEIQHPMAEAWNVRTVVVGQIKLDHPEPGGVMKMSIDAVEWVPLPAPVKTTTKPVGKATAARVGVPVIDIDSPDADAQIASLSTIGGIIAGD